jgi:hypothetical protein
MHTDTGNVVPYQIRYNTRIIIIIVSYFVQINLIYFKLQKDDINTFILILKQITLLFL